MQNKSVGAHEKPEEKASDKADDYTQLPIGSSGVQGDGSVPYTPPRKKRRKRWLIVLTVFLLLVFAVFFVFNHYYSKLNIVRPSTSIREWLSGIDESGIFNPNSGSSDVDEMLRNNLNNNGDIDFNDRNVINFLLIGVDNDNLSGMEDRGNADGLVILSINKRTDQIVLTSLMRDIYVSIPDSFNTKITLAYHYGGTQTLIDTIEANFGIPIDSYIMVNYLNVIDIVDALGGVTMDVTADELYWMEPKINNLNTLLGLPYSDNVIPPDEAGTLTLNGVQVAAYLRIRYAGNGDFDRTERARNVLLALKDKATGMNLIELDKLANTLLPCITTDLTQGEIISLLFNAAGYMKYDTVSSRIPIDDSFYFEDIGGSMVVIDFNKNKQYMYDTIYQGISPDEAANKAAVS